MSSVEEHHAPADGWEFVLDLIGFDSAALRNDVFEEHAEPRNVPLPVAQLVRRRLDASRGDVFGHLRQVLARSLEHERRVVPLRSARIAGPTAGADERSATAQIQLAQPEEGEAAQVA